MGYLFIMRLDVSSMPSQVGFDIFRDYQGVISHTFGSVAHMYYYLRLFYIRVAYIRSR